MTLDIKIYFFVYPSTQQTSIKAGKGILIS